MIHNSLKSDILNTQKTDQTSENSADAALAAQVLGATQTQGQSSFQSISNN